jgi:hypothetical protein
MHSAWPRRPANLHRPHTHSVRTAPANKPPRLAWQQLLPPNQPCAHPRRPAPQAVAVPRELWAAPASIRSLIQVPVGAPAAPRGVLLLGDLLPNGFEGREWQVRLHVAAAGLLPHVRHAQVEQMAHLLKAMDEAPDPVALISVLLRVRSSGCAAVRAGPGANFLGWGPSALEHQISQHPVPPAGLSAADSPWFSWAPDCFVSHPHSPD